MSDDERESKLVRLLLAQCAIYYRAARSGEASEEQVAEAFEDLMDLVNTVGELVEEHIIQA